MIWVLLIFVNAQYSISVYFNSQAACESGKNQVVHMTEYGVNKPVFTAVCVEDVKEIKHE